MIDSREARKNRYIQQLRKAKSEREQYNRTPEGRTEMLLRIVDHNNRVWGRGVGHE